MMSNEIGTPQSARSRARFAASGSTAIRCLLPRAQRCARFKLRRTKEVRRHAIYSRSCRKKNARNSVSRNARKRVHNDCRLSRAQLTTLRSRKRGCLCACAVNHTRLPREKARTPNQVTYEQNKDRWPPPPRPKSSGEVVSSGESAGSPKATGRGKFKRTRAQFGWPRSSNHLFPKYVYYDAPARRTLLPPGSPGRRLVHADRAGECDPTFRLAIGLTGRTRPNTLRHASRQPDS